MSVWPSVHLSGYWPSTKMYAYNGKQNYVYGYQNLLGVVPTEPQEGLTNQLLYWYHIFSQRNFYYSGQFSMCCIFHYVSSYCDDH